jgi:hypothetical protein
MLTFWYGSGSGCGDTYHWLTNPDPDRDPALFVGGFSTFFCSLLFQKIKCHKEVNKHLKLKIFLTFVLVIMEGPGSRFRSGSVQIR